MGRMPGIERLNPAETRRWDDFVARTEGASLYHRAALRDVIESTFGHDTHYLCAKASGSEIVGIFPLVRLRSRLFGDYLVSMPYFNYGGPVAVDPETVDALLARATEIAHELGCSHMEVRECSPRVDWPVRHDKVAMWLDLPGTADELWQGLSAKLRSQIRRPLKEGAEVIHGGADLLDEFYAVFSRNMRDLGTPVYPKRFFAAVQETFPQASCIIVIRLLGRPVAAGFLLGFRDRLEIPWASSLREANPLGVNMLLYWEALKGAIEGGYRVFDFGRSTRDSGPYRFKAQWGAREIALYWHYWLRDGGRPPELNPHNPKYRLAISAWQRLPLGVANRLGPHIVKYLP